MALSDIQIAQAATLKPVLPMAQERLGIPASALEPYGHYKAKIDLAWLDRQSGPRGKLILVTAISPTPAGEGKTTTTVGLGDALNYIGKKAIIALREPSLGPVFGVKAARPAVATHRWCPWRTSTCTSPATFRRSRWPTTCSPR
jgi:formate--tetrahydrofolate ligase